MIYTPKMKAVVKSIPVPVDFSLDIIEYNFVPPYIGLRFYESQWRHLSENERIKCIAYLAKVKKVIEAYGVQVTVDPVYDIPGVQKIG
jgi:hypothetical protein